MYEFRIGINSGYPKDEITDAVEDMFWRYFEEHLGEISDLWVQETLQDDLGLENEDPIDLEMYQYENADTIKSMLSLWMKQVIDRTENYNIIDQKIEEYGIKLKLKKQDYFLTFNYTHILERIYHIPDYRILHVHGENTEWGDCELIIGHGNDDAIREHEKIIEKFDGNDYSQFSRNRENEYKCELYNLKALRKDVDMCMRSCNYFLNKIEQVPKEICVYGLSLGDVDIPYLKRIKEQWNNIHWKFSYFSDKDKERIRDVAEGQMGLSVSQYSFFELRNEYFELIRDLIVKKQNIIEYEKI